MEGWGRRGWDLAEHGPVVLLEGVGGLQVVAGVGLVQAQADHLVPGRRLALPPAHLGWLSYWLVLT